MTGSIQKVVAALLAKGVPTDRAKAEKMLSRLGYTADEYLDILAESDALARQAAAQPQPPTEGMDSDKLGGPIAYTVENADDRG